MLEREIESRKEGAEGEEGGGEMEWGGGGGTGRDSEGTRERERESSKTLILRDKQR